MMNELKRLARKRAGLRKDGKGVSEILGDILLVSVAVVVISAIAAQVVNVRTPQGTKTVDLEARLDGNDLVITHMGGPDLQNRNAQIYVIIGDLPALSLKIKDGFTGTHLVWKIGEEWRYDIGSEITNATASGQSLYVQIVDSSKNQIILEQVLLGGSNSNNFPDIGFEQGSLRFSNSKPNGDEPLDIYVRVVNFGPLDVSNVEVRFYDDTSLIGVNKSILNLPHTGVGSKVWVTLNWTTTYLGRHIINVKVVPKANETNLANNYISTRLNVGFGINLDFTKPNLVITRYSISKDNPRTKETVTLTVKVGNTAKVQATGFTLKWGDVFQGVNTTMATSVHVGNVTYVNDIDLTYEWTPAKGGTHNLWAHIENVLPSGEDAKADADPLIDVDWGYLDVQVMPRVLLVDDDLAGKGTTRDTVTYMRESLKSLGVTYDIVTVGAGDGPQYSGTGVVLQNYDIVIWQAGYETSNTITTSGSTSDVTNLQKYLDNNGSLWLIGQDVANDLYNNGGADGKNFLKSYLHVSSQTLDVQMGSAIKGNSNCPVTNGMDMNVTVPTNLTAKPDLLNPDGNSIAAIDNATHMNISLLYNKTYKVAFYAFEFAQITGMSDRSMLAYKMLLWFNATVFFNGDDLAVSEVTISPASPHYKQEVAIKATIRNNGVNMMKDVKVVFKDVYMGIETIITPNIKDRAGGKQVYDNPMNVNMTAMGGQNITIKYWVPEKTGSHQLKVIVDPNDVIQEIDETNNEFVSDLLSTRVFVDSITLIVDDDQTAGPGAKNTTNSLRSTLDFLNYKYEVYTVPNAASDGPNLANLTKYNNVVWCFGNESGVGTTFRPNDMANIKSYLTGYQGNLWVIGQNFLDDTGPRNNVSFRRDLLGVSNTFTRNVQTPSTLFGVKNNNITHGMRYSATKTFGTAYDADTIDPATGAEAIFTNASGASYGTAFRNTTGVNYSAVVTTFEFSFITDKEDQRELAYMIFHWFGQSDRRIELRITWDDLYFAKDNTPPTPFGLIKPVLGNSYVLQAKVWNAGNMPAGALVRFLDGTTVISSASIYVPASTYDASGKMVLGSELAEVIWSPLFAGNRPITIKVDPDKNIPQITDPKSSIGEVLKKNNNVTRYIEVFFFYDDMESGTAYWNHEATLLNINGESPIEYLDSLRPVNTNVIHKLNATTGGWTQLFDDGHTMPSSFYAGEPKDINTTRITLRIGICIEDSAEIKTKDPKLLRLSAAWEFINKTLSVGDQVAIYRDDTTTTNLFKSENPGKGNFENFSFENSTKYLKNTGSAYFDNSGNHDLMGCINMGTTDLKDTWNEQGVYPALIVVTSAKTGIGQNDIRNMMDYSRQRGIAIYMVGVGDVDQDLSYDIAAVSNGGMFFYASTGDSLSSIFNILGNIIGSGGSRSMPDEPNDGQPSSRTAAPTASSGGNKLTLYNPVGTDKWAQGINRNVTFDCKGFTDAQCKAATISFYNPTTGKWNIITPTVVTQSPFKWTSDSSTFDPSGSEKVWQYNWTVPTVACGTCRISVQVTGGGKTLNVSSQAPGFTIFDSKIPMGQKHNTTVGNMTTQEFDLSNYKSAKLTFWHKYDLLATENGGVIYIGNSSNPNGPYKWHYVIPKKSYTGNLRMDKPIKDSDNTPVLFAYNGRSAGQTGHWAYDEVELTPFINSVSKYVRVRFSLYAWGYGNGGGWWMDDMKVIATRSDSSAITNSVADQWEYYTWTSGVDPVAYQPHSGTHMWWNHNPTTSHDLGKGIDNSLITRSIDLTNAKDAQISAYFKFNIDDSAGRPPDGFRVEVSSDNGVLWYPINLGVRASWGVSGYWSVDGKSTDGKKAYTGIQDGGVDTNTPAWVSSGTLWRLNTNLSGWAGSVVKLRFRVITDMDGTHYERDTIFKGIALDDLIVRGNTTISGAPIVRPDTTHGPQPTDTGFPDGPSAVNADGHGSLPHAGQAETDVMSTTAQTVRKDQGDA